MYLVTYMKDLGTNMVICEHRAKAHGTMQKAKKSGGKRIELYDIKKRDINIKHSGEIDF